MTERSSCKSFFKKYLVYRIKAQQMNLILCCILNILALPLFFTAQIKGFDNQFSDFYQVGRIFSVIIDIILLILAVFGAVFSFEYCNRKNLTDTIGSLPLSYKQRFCGDLLAGYITNVAPVIPCGLISAVIFAGAQNKFEAFCANVGFHGTVFSTFQLALCIAFSLFILLTFVYLFTVLVTSACGKFLHSVLFSIFGITALSGAVVWFAGCFAAGMLGINVGEYMSRATTFVLPLNSLIDLFNGFRILSGYFELFGGKSLSDAGIGDIFISANVLNLVYFVILSIGIILGAFYLGKRRKPEKTGSSFAVKPVFYAISSLMSASAVFLMIVMFVNTYSSFGKRYIIAAIAGAIMCVVSSVIYLPKRKELPRCILCGFAAVGVSVGLVVLLNKTGSFGSRYLPNAERIEYLRINDSYTVTDKADLKKYIERHNEILRDERNYLECGNIYTLEYRTTNGKTTKLAYSESFMTEINERYPIKNMRKNERLLAGYGKYFFESFSDNFDNWSCSIIDDNGTYNIPERNKTEFIAVLREEAEEKYDPDAEIYVRVEFHINNHRSKSFSIGKNLERTIAFLGDMGDTVEKDPNKGILQIQYMIYEPNNPDAPDARSLTVNVKNKDMDNALVKELIGLLKKYGEGESFGTEVVDQDKSFLVTYTNVSVTSSLGYYVPKENSKRVLQIMTELALEEFK